VRQVARTEHIILTSASWETYRGLVADRGGMPHPPLACDGTMLELIKALMSFIEPASELHRIAVLRDWTAGLRENRALHFGEKAGNERVVVTKGAMPPPSSGTARIRFHSTCLARTGKRTLSRVQSARGKQTFPKGIALCTRGPERSRSATSDEIRKMGRDRERRCRSSEGAR
jgi:hypothetical protein